MSTLSGIFSTRRVVVDGRVDCPLKGSASVHECATCPWLRSLKPGRTGPEAVFCRPRASSLADLPPV